MRKRYEVVALSLLPLAASEARDSGEFLPKLISHADVAEPDGKRLKTYLVGKMSENRIVGTFVDNSGIRGTWNATRI